MKIRGLWYDGDALDDYHGTPSTRGGRHKGQWVIRRDPRDRRQVFFQDPITHAWHALDWTGLPPVGQMPAFGDARARDLLRRAAACGLKPKSDSELLPVLLELIGSKIPVSQWPTQMTKSQRTDHAREVTQASAAEADRPVAPPSPPASTPERPDHGNVTPLRWRQRAQQTHDSIDADRRRRREAAVPVTPQPRPCWEPATGSATCSSFPTMTRRTVDQPNEADHPLIPFLRSGPPPDRTTWEGWQQWRLIRGSFTPALRLTLAEYTARSPRGRALHDLHRTATHVNLRLQETPVSKTLSDLMRGRLQNNAMKVESGTRDGLMINGGGFQGKTETACWAAAAFEDLWRDIYSHLLPGHTPGTRDLFVPVAYCRLPVRATPKALCKTILDVYTKAPARSGGYRPEHIPAFLEPERYQQHLAPLECPSVTSMRRTAAVLLVQWATGGPKREAADFLGINPRGKPPHPFPGLRAVAQRAQRGMLHHRPPRPRPTPRRSHRADRLPPPTPSSPELEPRSQHLARDHQPPTPRSRTHPATPR